MKYLVLLLSCILFCQTLIVCGSGVVRSTTSSEASACSAEMLLKKENSKHACCHKKNTSNKNKSSKKGCCDDDCRCLCCSKVFITAISPYKHPAADGIIPNETIIHTLTVHSFDFHESIPEPPQA